MYIFSRLPKPPICPLRFMIFAFNTNVSTLCHLSHKLLWWFWQNKMWVPPLLFHCTTEQSVSPLWLFRCFIAVLIVSILYNKKETINTAMPDCWKTVKTFESKVEGFEYLPEGLKEPLILTDVICSQSSSSSLSPLRWGSDAKFSSGHCFVGIFKIGWKPR